MKKLESNTNKLLLLAEKLAGFSILPDEALVSAEIVCAFYGRSKASIWRDVKAGRCPSPIRISTCCNRWRVGDLRKAVQNPMSESLEATNA